MKYEISASSNEAAQEKTFRRPSTARLALILGALAAFGPLSIDMYLPGLPTIAREFGTDTAAAQMTLALYFAGLAFGQAFYGPIADRWGRRRPLLFGCALYAAVSAACALAPTLTALVGLRFLQALGGCAGMVISRSVVRDLYDERESARMYSLLTLVMGLAPITAPFIGGQLLLVSGWRAIFWLLAAFGACCIGMVAFGLPESLPEERRVRADIGQALGVYLRLLRDRHFVGYALAGGFVSAGMFAYISGSPFVFIELYGVAPDRYGWIFGTNALGLVIASQINRWLLERYRSETILGAVLLFTVGAALALTATAATGAGGFVGLLIPLFVCIASVGTVGPNTTALAMEPHRSIAGSASALLGTLQFIVGAIAGSLVGALANGTAVPMAAVIAGCDVAALLCFWMVGRRRLNA